MTTKDRRALPSVPVVLDLTSKRDDDGRAELGLGRNAFYDTSPEDE